ncbi:MAG: dTDP-4-dehydrorhamnose reductase [Motiliproteus sp.]
MKLLLTGADGQFGRCLQDRAGDHQLIALNRHGLDITDAKAVSDCLQQHRPDIVINGAAYTDVDRAESEPEKAYAVNRDGAANLAHACAKLDIPLIHISTDYVFDGTATTPYKPNDPTNPINVYGKSKLAGEEAIREIWPKHLIIRTSWLFSEYGNNFVKTMLRLAKERDEISVVNDQVGCPTYAGHLAEVALVLLDVSRWGTCHVVGDPAISWHGFANAIRKAASEQKHLQCLPRIIPISTTEYPTAALRPLHSQLASTVVLDGHSSSYDLNWNTALDRVLASLKSSF